MERFHHRDAGDATGLEVNSRWKRRTPIAKPLPEKIAKATRTKGKFFFK